MFSSFRPIYNYQSRLIHQLFVCLKKMYNYQDYLSANCFFQENVQSVVKNARIHKTPWHGHCMRSFVVGINLCYHVSLMIENSIPLRTLTICAWHMTNVRVFIDVCEYGAVMWVRQFSRDRGRGSINEAEARQRNLEITTLRPRQERREALKCPGKAEAALLLPLGEASASRHTSLVWCMSNSTHVVTNG